MLHRPRRPAVAVIAAVLVAAVGCGSAEADPITIDVPDGWEELTGDRSGDAEVLRRYAPRDASGATMQVVLGCGTATAEDLVVAVTTRAFDGLGIAGVERDEAITVAGLDDARRVSLTLAPTVPDDTTDDVRLDGLYGTVDGALVLVELSAPAATRDAELVETVIGSLQVDSEAAAATCAGDASPGHRPAV